MIDRFNHHDDMINSVCDGFINEVNDVVPDNLQLLCNQDGYEMLTQAFGSAFRKNDVEGANNVQLCSIAKALGVFLEREVSVEEVCGFINGVKSHHFCGQFILFIKGGPRWDKHSNAITTVIH